MKTPTNSNSNKKKSNQATSPYKSLFSGEDIKAIFTFSFKLVLFKSLDRCVSCIHSTISALHGNKFVLLAISRTLIYTPCFCHVLYLILNRNEFLLFKKVTSENSDRVTQKFMLIILEQAI